MHPLPPRLAFTAATTEQARAARTRLSALYGETDPREADVLVALGGDGHMLETLHANLGTGRPIFGMNRGTIGFLLNDFREDGLWERVAGAHRVALPVLRMRATCQDGRHVEAPAMNEVSLLRETRQAARLRLAVDGIVRLPEMVCDGVLVATPAGSTAYNLSVHGPILPLDSKLLALTPISVFRPRRWRGALLSHDSRVSIEILEPEKRPVSAVADFTEVRDVVAVEIWEDPATRMHLLFDPEQNLAERILKEQFTP